MLIETRKSPRAQVYQPDARDVQWTGGVWKERTETCARVTVPHIRALFEDNAEIFHVVENFRIASGEHKGKHQGTPFGDGDFYKWMEAAMYAAMQNGDKKLEAELDAYIELIGRCQQPDGYLSTKQIIGEINGTGLGRLGDINDFEVYNFGHMFTSACLYKRIAGKDNFLNIAIKAAGYLKKMYEDAERTGEVQTAVCPSHYMGLIELYRTTGNEDFLKTAELAMALRDKVKNGTDDNQDRLPLREHHKIVGHGVRSTYLYAGVADLYLENGDETLLPVLHDVWNNCVHQKLYITGGCGAIYQGVSPYGEFWGSHRTHQAFGYEYQLPNITAYNETCASLGNIFWNTRMFAIEPDAKYMDVIERTMLNVTLASWGLDGNQYFYENMLRRTRSLDYKLVWPLERRERLSCFCCPPNLARTVAQSSELAYFLSEGVIWTGLYGASRLNYAFESGARGTLVQTTEYPYDGRISFHCENVENNAPITLKLRIPEWFSCGTVTVNGVSAPIEASPSSYIAVKLDRPAEDVVELDLNITPRLTVAHSKVEEDINQAAVECGPLVYCMETPDADLETLDDLMLPANASFTAADMEIKGRKVRTLETEVMVRHSEGFDREALYQTLRAPSFERRKARLIPYYAWDNRGFGEMRIWIPIYFG